MIKISRRSYAKRRGVSETAIRKRIADGTLAQAMTADGQINPDIADRLLAENTTAGNQTTSGLSEARRRKAAASIALLRDEVEALEGSFVPHDQADAVVKWLSLIAARRMLQVADIAAQVAGKPPAVAAVAIDEAVRAAQNDIAATPIPKAKKPSAKGKAGKSLASMSLVQLATLRADLHARRLEVQRRVKRGEVIALQKLEYQLMHRLAVFKTNCSAMHAKLAPRFEGATPAKARTILLTELHQIVEALACKAVTAAELTNSLKTKTRRAA